MKFCDKKVQFDIIPLLTKKAAHSPCKFFVAAAAFTKKGNLLGVVSNTHNNRLFASKRGQGRHAETELIGRYGKRINTIYLIRIGKDMSRLPIHPCENCQKVIDKFGITVIPVHIEFGYKPSVVYP